MPQVTTATAAAGDGVGQSETPNPSRDLAEKFVKLRDSLNAAPEPGFGDLRELQELVVAEPKLWFLADHAWHTRDQLIRKMAKGAERAMISARLKLLEKQLIGLDGSPLAAMVIEQILMSWLRFQMAERIYNDRVVGASSAEEAVTFWDQFLANAQRRHLNAIEALARIGRLGKIGPGLQVNIAHKGSQQLNVQGEIPQKSSAAQ